MKNLSKKIRIISIKTLLAIMIILFIVAFTAIFVTNENNKIFKICHEKGFDNINIMDGTKCFNTSNKVFEKVRVCELEENCKEIEDLRRRVKEIINKTN